MKSAAIKGLDSLQAYTARKTDKRQEDLLGDFSNIFGRATSQQQMTAQTDGFMNGTLKSRIESMESRGMDQRSALQSSQTSKTSDMQSADRLDSKVEEAGDKMVSAIAKELGVSEEEIVEAMEALGITPTDLLNPEHLTQLVLAVKGVDALALMTEEGLYNSLKDLLAMMEELKNELASQMGISKEELNMLLEQMDAVEASAELMAEASASGTEDYEVTVERDGKITKVSVEVDGNLKSESAEVITVNGKEELLDQDGEKKGDSNTGLEQEGKGTNLLLQNLMNHEAGGSMEASFEQMMTGRSVNTQDIMNQIMEYMRVHIKADMTQMEIQLHPASLGTVNVNITSKEGVITAQFLAQNEAVKAVIESQLVQLRNSFEEQGIKVEAVEVAVETHEFERNLSGEGNQDQKQYGEKKKGTRKLNLKEISLEDMEADLTEEEQIAVSIMNIEGNTVDYMA